MTRRIEFEEFAAEEIGRIFEEHPFAELSLAIMKRRSPEAYRHIIRVSKIRLRLDSYLDEGETEQEQKEIRYGNLLASLYHDIGKLAVDVAIVNKPSREKFSPQEIAEMQPHAVVGARVVSEFDPDVPPIVLMQIASHHEIGNLIQTLEYMEVKRNIRELPDYDELGGTMSSIWMRVVDSWEAGGHREDENGELPGNPIELAAKVKEKTLGSVGPGFRRIFERKIDLLKDLSMNDDILKHLSIVDKPGQDEAIGEDLLDVNKMKNQPWYDFVKYAQIEQIRILRHRGIYIT